MFDEPANDLRAAATVRGTVRLVGVGLHTGEDCELIIEPVPAGQGIRFIRSDLEGPMAQRTIAADPALVTKTQLGTVLTNAHGASISTVEHLMAAFAMLGITEADVFIDGPEIPILDGSSKNFLEAIEKVGVRVYPHTIEPIAPKGEVTVAQGDSWAIAEPLPEGSGAEVILDVTIDFDHPSIGLQRIIIEGDRETILKEVAEARTFTELRHVEALREIGLARGGSLENAIVLNDEGVMNEGGIRMEREFVRHKALDLVGDLYLLGAPLGCKITAHKPGHTLNTALANALAADERESFAREPMVATA
ncbi:UDP-3-O-[3-hydroxymyristoyl] N-acetylglucosamine deacetylase [Parvularcula sp. ZS-1/3]|uniref:UDP-3-O-acyl-N-acetylglucosamine deacetylase n=1 Tax=Parvularcula mediterranea TaxID=2732508 RepID=A0A7Y3W5G5_9PROT|nr:UDP-3-O-acyl-N-acetylglucosamine deacetylase [Parvularcula mediterranea]NNU16251.1 UDP-3-O-[3-hydroxymyristoyl] N-acetylglucosamine deacetylase [Parvularcula mediterranea]